MNVLLHQINNIKCLQTLKVPFFNSTLAFTFYNYNWSDHSTKCTCCNKDLCKLDHFSLVPSSDIRNECPIKLKSRIEHFCKECLIYMVEEPNQFLIKYQLGLL
ncbi:MAG: hypothetical protein CMC55_08650 [Flavobacteriaceae bacterium]|nr:hypothetical protein [Flavobacteriaceae bacterium]